MPSLDILSGVILAYCGSKDGVGTPASPSLASLSQLSVFGSGDVSTSILRVFENV